VLKTRKMKTFDVILKLCGLLTIISFLLMMVIMSTYATKYYNTKVLCHPSNDETSRLNSNVSDTWHNTYSYWTEFKTNDHFSSIRSIFLITPTYKRLTRQSDLTVFAQTLINIPRLHWILIEDASEIDQSIINNMLIRLRLNFTYIAQPPTNESRTQLVADICRETQQFRYSCEFA